MISIRNTFEEIIARNETGYKHFFAETMMPIGIIILDGKLG
jgi:hypothetical protein